MNKLSQWLRGELQRRELTQAAAAVHSGVASATISGILVKDHVPKVETLFRLADFFETPREEILRIAGHLPPQVGHLPPQVSHLPPRAGVLAEAGDELVEELVVAFRQVPDEWKEDVLAQVRLFARLANRPEVRLVGEDRLAPEPEEAVDEAG